MRIKEAVILAAGKGTRLLPLTENTPKPLIKIGGEEIITNIIKGIEKAKIKHIIIVVDHLAEKFMEYIDNYPGDIELEIVSQIEKKGTAAAIESIEEFVSEHFLVASGDHVLDNSIYKDVVDSYKGKSVVMLKEVEHPENYGVAIVENGEIKEMEEKPEKPKSNLANIGIYSFNREIFEEIKNIKLSKRGEYEITDILVGKEALSTKKYWIDVGYPWNILDANKWLLSHKEENNKARIINSTIKGKLITGENVIIENSYIEGNVYIGDNTKIGPFAYIRDSSIGNNCNIGIGTTVKNSVVGDNVNAKHLSYIGDSVVGNNVNFGSSTQIANLRFDNKNVLVRINGILKDSGKRKFGAVIGDNVKTGVNVSILPGRVIENDAVIFPGKVVDKSVKKGEQFK